MDNKQQPVLIHIEHDEEEDVNKSTDKSSKDHIINVEPKSQSSTIKQIHEDNSVELQAIVPSNSSGQAPAPSGPISLLPPSFSSPPPAPYPVLDEVFASHRPTTPCLWYPVSELQQHLYALPLITQVVEAQIFITHHITHQVLTFHNSSFTTRSALLLIPYEGTVASCTVKVGDREIHCGVVEKKAVQQDSEERKEGEQSNSSSSPPPSYIINALQEHPLPNVFVLPVYNILQNQQIQVDFSFMAECVIRSGIIDYTLNCSGDLTGRLTLLTPHQPPISSRTHSMQVQVYTGVPLTQSICSIGQRLEAFGLQIEFPLNPSPCVRLIGMLDIDSISSNSRKNSDSGIEEIEEIEQSNQHKETGQFMLSISAPELSRHSWTLSDIQSMAQIYGGSVEEKMEMEEINSQQEEKNEKSYGTDVIILLDRGQSMLGNPWLSTVQSVELMLGYLCDNDRFTVYVFDKEVQYFRQASGLHSINSPSQTSSTSIRRECINWLMSMIPSKGDVNLKSPIETAFIEMEQAQSSRQKKIWLITDGCVQEERDILNLYEQRYHDTLKNFTFNSIALGPLVNTYFLQYISAITHGYCLLVPYLADIHVTLERHLRNQTVNFFTNMTIQCQSDCTVKLNIIPHNVIQNLSLGGNVTVYGTYSRDASNPLPSCFQLIAQFGPSWQLTLPIYLHRDAQLPIKRLVAWQLVEELARKCWRLESPTEEGQSSLTSTNQSAEYNSTYTHLVSLSLQFQFLTSYTRMISYELSIAQQRKLIAEQQRLMQQWQHDQAELRQRYSTWSQQQQSLWTRQQQTQTQWGQYYTQHENYQPQQQDTVVVVLPPKYEQQNDGNTTIVIQQQQQQSRTVIYRAQPTKCIVVQQETSPTYNYYGSNDDIVAMWWLGYYGPSLFQDSIIWSGYMLYGMFKLSELATYTIVHDLGWLAGNAAHSLLHLPFHGLFKMLFFIPQHCCCGLCSCVEQVPKLCALICHTCFTQWCEGIHYVIEHIGCCSIDCITSLCGNGCRLCFQCCGSLIRDVKLDAIFKFLFNLIFNIICFICDH